jgi:hypothetical protein
VNGGSTLEHFNQCSALKEMIAGRGKGFFAWNGMVEPGKTAPMADEAHGKDGEIATQPAGHWKAHGPVLTVSPEKAELVDVPPPALIKKKRARRSRFRTGRFKPHPLLDALIETLTLENDAALAETLRVSAPVISKIRSGKLPVGPSILMRMHETSDIPIARLRALIPEYTRYKETIDESDEPQEHYR